MGMGDEGLISPKESGRKRCTLKSKSKVCCTVTEDMHAKIHILEVF